MNVVVVSAAEDEPTAERKSAGGEARVGVGWLEGSNLLICTQIPESRCLVLRRRHESVSRRMIL